MKRTKAELEKENAQLHEIFRRQAKEVADADIKINQLLQLNAWLKARVEDFTSILGACSKEGTLQISRTTRNDEARNGR